MAEFKMTRATRGFGALAGDTRMGISFLDWVGRMNGHGGTGVNERVNALLVKLGTAGRASRVTWKQAKQLVPELFTHEWHLARKIGREYEEG